jgi:hypothetical protein
MASDASRGDRVGFPSKPTPRPAPLSSDFAAFNQRATQLLLLASIAAEGPDPEALLPDVAELSRLCAAFVQAHPSP